MKRSLLTLLFMATAWNAFTQTIIPFEFRSEDHNRFLKETDSFKYYVASHDTLNTVAISEEFFLYKLFNEDMKMIAEGGLIVDGDKYLQDGRWTEYFNSGMGKRMGYYRRNVPVGTWQEFYSSGKLKKVSNYGIFIDKGAFSACLSGTYQEFYSSGNLKISGFYSAVMAEVQDTVIVTDPITNKDLYTITNRNKLVGTRTGRWEYFEENGELQKKEEL